MWLVSRKENQKFRDAEGALYVKIVVVLAGLAKQTDRGIEQKTPKGYTPTTEGEITVKPMMSGLYHHYERIVS